MEVGNRIRRERQRLGISQEELSRRAYVSRPTLSHWETGRTLALACVAVGAGVCLVAVSFTARYLVGSVAFYSMTLLGMVMGFTVIARAGERAVSAASAAGVLAELAAGKCAAADKVVLRERLAHEIARDGVRDPYARLALGAACAVDIACMLVWFATLIRPGLFA